MALLSLGVGSDTANTHRHTHPKIVASNTLVPTHT